MRPDVREGCVVGTTARRWAVWAVAGATLAVAVPWAVAEIAGTELEATTGGTTIDVGLPLVLGAALSMSLAGWGLLVWLRRRGGGAATPGGSGPPSR